MNQEFKKGEVVIYKAADGPMIDVHLDQDTVWLTQKQMSGLFETERSVITKYLKNIFKSGELEEQSNVQKMHIANSDKPVAFYNLDIIISLGYRVNSKRGTQFRIWATRVLRKRIDDNALVALTLMIAASKPAEKETMINVILNLLAAVATLPRWNRIRIF
jgi:hypothetical protein